MYLDAIDVENIKHMEIGSLKSLLMECYETNDNGPETETGKKLKAIEDAIKEYPASNIGELEIKVWLARSILFGVAPTDRALEQDGDSPEEQTISQILKDIQQLKKATRAEYSYGADIAKFKDSPDFDLIRMVKTSKLLIQAFNIDPRDECPEKEAYLNQSLVLEDLIAETLAKTPEGLKAKIMYTWDDYGACFGATGSNLIEGVFENVVSFLEDHQKAA